MIKGKTMSNPSSGECETTAEVQTQLDINEKLLTQLSETVNELSRRLGFISLPQKAREPSGTPDPASEVTSLLRTVLIRFGLHTEQITGQIEDLMNRLEI